MISELKALEHSTLKVIVGKKAIFYFLYKTRTQIYGQMYVRTGKLKTITFLVMFSRF